MGIQAGGQESLSREWGSGVSTGTRPGSEVLGQEGNYGSNFTETTALIKKRVGGSRGITR